RQVLFFFEVFELLLQAAFREHVLELAPSCLPFLRGRRSTGPGTTPGFNESIVARPLVAFGDELIIEIEVIVVSLHHALLHPTDSNTAQNLPVGHPTLRFGGVRLLLQQEAATHPKKSNGINYIGSDRGWKP